MLTSPQDKKGLIYFIAQTRKLRPSRKWCKKQPQVSIQEEKQRCQWGPASPEVTDFCREEEYEVIDNENWKVTMRSWG